MTDEKEDHQRLELIRQCSLGIANQTRNYDTVDELILAAKKIEAYLTAKGGEDSALSR